MSLESLETDRLRIGYLDDGPRDGWPVVLLHGFPYDVHAYAAVTPILVATGARVIVPYLRGFGPTRLLAPATPRSGEQAALGADLVALLDALALPAATLAGFDWGGRAACVVAAVWPERVLGLVTHGGYNIQDVARAGIPSAPEDERRKWYQYYLHGERGRAGLATNRRAFCEHLWRLWSPTWSFTAATFAQTAAAFDNDDFVAVVVHSYRVRFGLAPNDPAYAAVERRLATKPPIRAPTIVLACADDGVEPPAAAPDLRAGFTGPYERRWLAGVGHASPHEAPHAFADAVIAVRHLR